MIRKLAIVTDGWYPVVDGVVRTIEARKKELEKRGIEVTVINPNLFQNIRMPFDHQVRMALFPRARMRTLLASGNFDAIHIETEGPLGSAARAACRKLKFPYTTAHHTNLALYIRIKIMPGLDWLVYAYLSRFHRNATRMMVSTETLRQNLISHGFKNDIVVVPLGVDTELFRPRPEEPSLPYPKPIFTYMGRVAPEKSVREFLELDLAGTKLVIGDGEDKERFEKEFPDAVFTGLKEGEELAKLLAGSDVFVFPSRTETFGLTILEALACGVPAAVYDCMGSRDVVTNGVDGYLSEDLKDAAQKALKLSREKCREKALQYTWPKSVDIFLENLAPISRQN
ncbi:MAG TPA: glycosyltransferase family 1 protein [Candidatus Paceibacterota bacterium]|nr:glycosyltransferase family 1 protein [Candidatus Paceibacterota bacterium]